MAVTALGHSVIESRMLVGKELPEQLKTEQKEMHGMKIYHLARIEATISLTSSSMAAVPLQPPLSKAAPLASLSMQT